MEHNEEHAQGYSDWADKLHSLGQDELSEIMNQISEETRKTSALFQKAIDLLER
ncbi:hypothetical protein MCHI_001401 [Candidatus Magnetoovum chiemensis]|nr:hypothetical protein MCHI_001401 [Candidatus Magnetoovum chiemensis]